MFDSTQIKKGTGGYERILFIGSMLTLVVALMISTATAQSAANTGPNWNGYNVTAAVEFGWRFRSVSGSENKYKSDLNYKKGFRTFDTNLVMESDSGKGKYFDSLLLTNSGWGSDPQGYTRLSISKIGIYNFNGNVRRTTYFNNLSNHALGEHTSNAANTSGDFDIVFLPQNEKLKFNLGMSFGKFTGPGLYTTRAYSDEFAADRYTRNKNIDYRAGVEGELAGFHLGFTQGFRFFKDTTDYSITTLNVGNNPLNTSALSSFSRTYPTNGSGYYSAFNVHRSFAKKLDFTGRFIYTLTKTNMSLSEYYIGRDGSNNFIDLDRFGVLSDANRIQKKADVGITYMVTNNFRISNTFNFDTFALTGGEFLQEDVTRRNPSGLPLASTLTRSTAYRVNKYQKYINTLEGDYQFNNSVSLHLGYRYTHRTVDVSGYGITLTSAPSTSNPSLVGEDEKNSTNAIIAGMKIKPMKNWVIFWDVEKGDADNIFSRLENLKYTNFRVRSRLSVNKFTLNLSAISKDNTNPTLTLTGLNFGTNIKHRYYAGSLDWDPIRELTFSTGYTYHHLTANTPINIPLTAGQTLGSSIFFMRDHYAYFDVSAKPFKRMSLYASYRISRDKGQGDRFSPLAQDIYTSYPMQMQSPEFRMAFRITRNIDWNVGYQYFNYRDSQTPSLNYKASLPYTSLRIYFGNGALDR